MAAIDIDLIPDPDGNVMCWFSSPDRVAMMAELFLERSARQELREWGVHISTLHQISVDHRLSCDEMRRRIRYIARGRGHHPRRVVRSLYDDTSQSPRRRGSRYLPVHQLVDQMLLVAG